MVRLYLPERAGDDSFNNCSRQSGAAVEEGEESNHRWDEEEVDLFNVQQANVGQQPDKKSNSRANQNSESRPEQREFGG